MFGHRNGSEWFRIIPECRKGLPEPPGKLWAIMGHEGREKAAPGGGAPPHEGSGLDGGGGGARPPFPSPSPSLSFPFSNPSWTRKGESYSHREEDSPSLGAPPRPAGLPLAPLYTGAGGHPKKTHKLIL